MFKGTPELLIGLYILGVDVSIHVAASLPYSHAGLKVQQVLKCVKSTPLLVDDKLNTQKAASSFRMLERLFTFVRHCINASREVSCGVLTKVCIGPAHKLFETFVFSPLSAHGVKPYFHQM